MPQDNHATTMVVAGPAGSAIFVSVEMSRLKWVVGVHTPLAEKIALHAMACCDVDALLMLIERMQIKLVAAGFGTSAVVVCYEAGYEGFWLHRRLVPLGMRVVVIDPASLLVDRRAKRAKTDRIDARGMVRALMAWARGERQVLSEVHVPTVKQDDARRGLRERQRLVKERTAHGNRIKGLLKTQGIMDFDPRAADASTRLDKIVTGDGRPLGPCLKREIMRELERLALVMQQIDQVEAERDAVVQAGDAGAGSDAPAAEPEREATMIAVLNRLKGIGMNDATVLVREAFWRDFRNRREVGGWSGLAPSPWASGSVSRDQGITKAGPPMLRAHMVQMSWRWLMWQPNSDLARWFRKRTEGATGRMRRIMVVALARKLLIALWRYATTGMIPHGAIVT
jgi:transposase